MIEAFAMGGWGMYPTAFFGLLMLGASIRYALQPERRFLPLQVSLGILTLLAGAMGFVTGVIMTFSHMGEVGPDQKWIAMLGVGESLHNVALALMLVIFATILSSVGAFRLGLSEPKKD